VLLQAEQRAGGILPLGDEDAMEEKYVGKCNNEFSDVLRRACLYKLMINNIEVNMYILYLKKLDNIFNIIDNYRKKSDFIIIVVEDQQDIDYNLVEALKRMGVKVVTGSVPVSFGEKVGLGFVKPVVGSKIEKIFNNIKNNLYNNKLLLIKNKNIKFIDCELVFLPLRCYNILINEKSSRHEIRVEHGELCFELASGSLVSFDEGLKVDSRLSELGDLDETSLLVLEFLGKKGEASFEEIAEIVGSEERAEIALQVLGEHGLVGQLGFETFILNNIKINNNNRVYSLLVERKLLVPGNPKKMGKLLEPTVSVSKLDRIISVYGRIKNKYIIYYPIYLGLYFDEGKNEEIVVLVDGVSGVRNEELEDIVASSDMILQIDEIVEYLVNNDGGCERVKRMRVDDA